jgi:hypothetical protein
VDSPHPKGDTNMSVQMIELEEVQMIETSDDTLEAVFVEVALYTISDGQAKC